MNSVVLIGRLTRDPEVRYGAASQMAVAKFTLAVDRGGKDRNGEDRGADFIGIICFGKTAELVEKYVTKGQQVAVQGRIQTGKYEKDGRTVYTTDVVADRVEFLGKGNQGAGSNFGGQSNSGSGFAGNNDIPEGFSSMDDDQIPF